MIDIGDQIAFKATCLEVNADGYLFALSEDIPYNERFVIHLSQTDEANNQLIHNALDKLKQ